MTDIESWSELADLYINLHRYERFIWLWFKMLLTCSLACNCSYDKAAFCLEELLLNNPHHYLYHLRYAEVRE